MLEGWVKTTVGEVVTIASGQVDPKDSAIANLLSVGPDNLFQGGGIDHASLRSAKELGQISGKYAFDSEAILYSKIRPNLNKAALPDFEGICSADMYPMWISDTSRADREFVYYILTSEIFVANATARSFRTGLPKINREDLESIAVVLPSLPEQRRIAEILRTWDEAIEKLEALRTTKETLRKGILQSLLHIDRPYPSNWDVRPINKIATRIQRKNDGGNHPVLTISAKSGFLMQSDKFARDMAGSSVDRYTLLYKGEFAFNKGNSKTAPYGCIFPLNRPSAVIPFVYYCFKLNDEIHSAFYTHLFAAGVLNHQLSRLINSGVRNDGLFNLYADDFFGCQVPVPPIAEQKSIAQAITAMNAELDLIDAEIDALQRQKRGLMQKLLTGEWRVNITETNFLTPDKEIAHG